MHWALAATVLAMIATGIALGVNIWHGVAFPVHVASVFVLAAGIFVTAIVGDPGALSRAGVSSPGSSETIAAGSAGHRDACSAAAAIRRRSACSTRARS